MGANDICLKTVADDEDAWVNQRTSSHALDESNGKCVKQVCMPPTQERSRSHVADDLDTCAVVYSTPRPPLWRHFHDNVLDTATFKQVGSTQKAADLTAFAVHLRFACKGPWPCFKHARAKGAQMWHEGSPRTFITWIGAWLFIAIESVVSCTDGGSFLCRKYVSGLLSVVYFPLSCPREGLV